MPARTGREFLGRPESAPRRSTWADDKVSDIADHPALRGAAEELAAIFDLQHRRADRCLVPDPETGEPINASHLIPRCRDDLMKRHARAGGLRRAQRRSDGADARLHERHLRRLRGAPR